MRESGIGPSRWDRFAVTRVLSTRGSEDAPFSVGDNGEEFFNSLQQDYDYYPIIDSFWYHKLLVVSKSDADSFDGYLVTLIKKRI